MKFPEQYRLVFPAGHPLHSKPGEPGGSFLIPWKDKRTGLYCVAGSGGGWDHLSVSLVKLKGGPIPKTPTWEMMCRAKGYFWEPEQEAYQFHPRKSEYVNMHPYVLHIWRKQEFEIPRPEKLMVGFNVNREIPPENKNPFIQYLKEARRDFVNAVNTQDWNTNMRTASEDILLAFDQMLDFVTSTQAADKKKRR